MKVTQILLLFAASLLMFTGCGKRADSLAAQEYTVKTVPNPQNIGATNFVSNPDNILSEPAVSQINGILQSLYADTQTDVDVVMLNSIGDEDIVDFSVRLFKEWGIGQKGLDNGLLILFVLDRRTVRFEVGYGLEGVLPDIICHRIQQQTMVPEFKNGDYAAGIVAGVERVASCIREEPVNEYMEEVAEPAEPNTFGHDLLIATVSTYSLLMLIFFFLEWRLIRKIKKNPTLRTNQERYKAFATSTKSLAIFAISPLLAFVAVCFGESGAIFVLPLMFSIILFLPALLFRKVWKRKFRRQPFPCPHCGKRMHRLSEKKDNQYLELSEDMEDSLKSIDADVFWCDHCQQSTIYKYNNESSKYKKCPKCQTKAFYVTNTKTVTPATYASSGLAEETFVCKFCNHTETKSKTLPRLTSSSGGSGGSSFRSHSGGHSSGRSSGGRSGGGGSSSRW
jgi:uncharacterized protein